VGSSPPLDRVDDPEAWVRTVAWRLGISRLRRLRTAWAWRDRQRRLLVEQRRALVIYPFADLSVEQVADETGVPVGEASGRPARLPALPPPGRPADVRRATGSGSTPSDPT